MKGALAFTCMLGLLAAPGFAAKIYTWVDEQGTTHYGAQPPKNVEAKLVNARTGHSEPVPGPEAAQADKSEPAAPPVQPMAVKDPERCAVARKNLATLQSGQRVKIPDDNGNLRFISDSEKQAQLAEMQQIADESCE